MRYHLLLIFYIAIALVCVNGYAHKCRAAEKDERVIRLYIDADFQNSASSSNAIKNGVLTALLEYGNKIAGREVELVMLDHHGNSRRSRMNLIKYDNDPDALAVYCGLHSPPVLVNLEMIQQKQILLLDPWAAAGQITRKTDAEGRNWVFRLSVDDTKAGEVMVRCAVDIERYKKPALLLEDTGWGKSNRETIITALAERGLEPVSVIFFDWKLGKVGSAEIIADLKKSGADVIFLVANAPEGKTLLRAMSERDKEDRIPIRSHWGITGGDLFDSLGKEILVDKIDLKFLQTSFSFLDTDLPEYAEEVFANLQTINLSLVNKEDLVAPVGFIHAYDLTKLLIIAINSIEWKGRAVDNRDKVRVALENINKSVRGLIKEYRKPFSKFTEDSLDAHEALTMDDLRMAEYHNSGTIRLIKNISSGGKGVQ